MFTVYFDASRTKHETVLTVAGFVARQRRWDRFENEWKQLLPRRTPMFHMTDFASSKAGWETWRGKHEQRAVFLDKLVRCIMRNTNKGFGISLQLNAYHTFNGNLQLEEASGGPYSLACQAFLAEVKKWAGRNRLDYLKDILYVCEDGDKGKGEMMFRARQDGFNVIPQSKSFIRAFDACDLAAWKMARLVDDAVVKELHLSDERHTGFVKNILRQFGSILQLNALLDAATLQAARDFVGIPGRSR